MDALGSLRGVLNPTGGVLEGQDYAPYGTPFGQTGTVQTPFGFTGEATDLNGLLNLRARYYVPQLGVFPSLDPVEEGNRYGYVGGDVVNRVDPSGMIGERPERWMCLQPEDPCAFCYDPRYGGYRDPFGIAACIALCEEQQRTLNFTEYVYLITYANSLYSCLSSNNCSLSPSPSDEVIALADLVEYASKISPLASTRVIVDQISYILVGSRGATTIVKEGSSIIVDSGYQGASDAHPLAMVDARGHHPHYYQGKGQIYHFWSYLNTSAQGGRIYAEIADVFHECLESDSAGKKQGTPQDARLTTVAVKIGEEIWRNQHTPLSLAQTLKTTLKSPFRGVLLPHYSELPVCWWLKELEANTR